MADSGLAKDLQLHLLNQELDRTAAQFDKLDKQVQRADKTVSSASGMKALEKNQKSYQKTAKKTAQQNQKLGDTFAAASGPIQGATAQFKAFAAVLKANPILTILAAIVAAFKLLSDAFKRSDEGRKAFASGLGALKGVVAVVSALFDRLAEVIIGVFQDPKKAVLDFWDFLKENIMNRIAAIGDTFKALGGVIENTFKGRFSEAKDSLKDLGQAVVQFGTGLDKVQQAAVLEGVVKAAGEANDLIGKSVDLERDKLALREKEIRDKIRISQLELEIAKSRELISDKTADEETRLRAIQSGREATAELEAIRVGNAEEALRLRQLENSLGKNTLEDTEQEVELVKRVNRERQSGANQRRVFARAASSLLDEQAMSRLKAIDAEAKAMEASAMEVTSFRIEQFQQLLAASDLTAKQRADIEARLTKELAAMDKLRTAEAAKEQQNRQELALLSLEQNRDTLAARAADETASVDHRLAAIEQLKEAEIELLNEQQRIALLSADSEAERARIIYDTEQEILDIRAEATKSAEELRKDAMEKEIAALEAQGMRRQEIANQALQFATGIFQIESNLIEQRRLEQLAALDAQGLSEEEAAVKRDEINKRAAKEEAEVARKAAIAEKAAALFSIASSTAAAIAKSLAASPLTFGLPWAAVAAATGALQAGAVLSKPLPQVPAYGDGTDDAHPGIALVGEKGAELVIGSHGATLIPEATLVNMRGGEQVLTAQETSAALAAGSVTLSPGDRKLLVAATRQRTVVNVDRHGISTVYATAELHRKRYLRW